jgi:hypothetical protein
MSDDIMETETEVDFDHYVTAIRELVEDFRYELHRHRAKLHQKAIEAGGQVGNPQEAAELHRLHMACDNFLNALVGNF